MAVQTVALLTAGGLAPCLSSAVGGLIERYTAIAPNVRIIAYQNGYAGLLTGRFVEVTREVRAGAALLHRFGGSPIGNSRVKLTNVADCVKRGLVKEGQDPQKVAADQLTPYPPGIPVLVPGQVITPEIMQYLAGLLRSHKRVELHGIVYDGYIPCVRVLTLSDEKGLKKLRT